MSRFFKQGKYIKRRADQKWNIHIFFDQQKKHQTTEKEVF